MIIIITRRRRRRGRTTIITRQITIRIISRTILTGIIVLGITHNQREHTIKTKNRYNAHNKIKPLKLNLNFYNDDILIKSGKIFLKLKDKNIQIIKTNTKFEKINKLYK